MEDQRNPQQSSMAMAAPQQYSLCWNNYSQHIVNALNDLRINDELTDVTLKCDGGRVKAHKILLSACSNYFREAFKSNPCNHPIVILKGVHLANLRAVVRFMYNGQVNVPQEQLQSFLRTAELLQIKGLTDMAEKDEVLKKRPKCKRPVESASGFSNQSSPAAAFGPSTSNKSAHITSADGTVVPTRASVTTSNHSQNSNNTQDDGYSNIGVVQFEDDDIQGDDDYDDKMLFGEDNDNPVQDMLQVVQGEIGEEEDEDDMDNWNGRPSLDPSRFFSSLVTSPNEKPSSMAGKGAGAGSAVVRNGRPSFPGNRIQSRSLLSTASSSFPNSPFFSVCGCVFSYL